MKISLRCPKTSLFWVPTCISVICYGANAFVPYHPMTPVTLQFVTIRNGIILSKKYQAGFHQTTRSFLQDSATPTSARTKTSGSCLHASSSSSQTTKTKSKQKKMSKKKKLPLSEATTTEDSTTFSATVYRPVGPGRSLSHDELSNHVSGRYLEGKRQRMGLASASSDATSTETREYVKQLNCRPSLVLNADYQVRKVYDKKGLFLGQDDTVEDRHVMIRMIQICTRRGDPLSPFAFRTCLSIQQH
jgi:hypothetical protein